MSDAPQTLRDLQTWLQQAITHATDVQEVSATITPSARQDSLQRLAIYQRAYFARLIEVLRELFPAMVQALDQESFDGLALAYLEQHPPRSYTLNRLADHFVDFLTATRPARDAADCPDWADFVIDLARLELSIDDVFDGPGVEGEPPLDPAALAAVARDPGGLQLRVAPCVRLLSLQFPLHDYYTAFRRGEAPPLPPPKPTWLALHRRDYVVRRLPLEQAEYAVLAAIVAGRSLEAAIATAIPLVPAEVLPGRLQGWFRDWAAAGLFVNADT